MKKYNKPLLICLISLLLLSFVPYIDNSNYWLLDILSNFPLQYALISLALMSISLWQKAASLTILSGILFVFNISAIIDSEDYIHAAEHTSATFKVYSANIYVENEDLSRFSQEIQVIDPDIVLLVEVTSEQVEQIRPVVQSYPFHIEKRSIGELGNGVAFLSKFPVLDHHITILSEEGGNILLEATIEINQKPVMFYGIHALRPGKRNFNERKKQFHWLARQIQEQTLPVIVMGDFNTSPFSAIFRELLRTTRLKDSREGFGWQPTWPVYFPLLWLPIDHILVSPNIQVLNRTTGSFIGSDHFPVLAELSINL